jgi:hypothetical protein
MFLYQDKDVYMNNKFHENYRYIYWKYFPNLYSKNHWNIKENQRNFFFVLDKVYMVDDLILNFHNHIGKIFKKNLIKFLFKIIQYLYLFVYNSFTSWLAWQWYAHAAQNPANSSLLLHVLQVNKACRLTYPFNKKKSRLFKSKKWIYIMYLWICTYINITISIKCSFTI